MKKSDALHIKQIMSAESMNVDANGNSQKNEIKDVKDDEN